MTEYSGGGGGLAADITIGTSIITSGTDTRVLFDDAGVVGESAGLTYAKTTGVLTVGTGLAGNSVFTGTGSASGGLDRLLTVKTTANTGTLVLGSVTGVDRPALGAFGATYLGIIGGTTGTLFYNNAGSAFSGVIGDAGYWRIGDGTIPTARFEVDNKAVAQSIFVAMDNGTPVFTVADGGAVTATASINANAGVSLNATAASNRMISKTVTLTEAGGAETVITITNATTQTFGVDFWYTVTCTDGTDRATRKGYLTFVADNAAGTVTATKDATNETDDASILIATGGATLTYAIALDVATANTTKLTFNIDSSLVVTAASITWTALLNGTGTIA